MSHGRGHRHIIPPNNQPRRVRVKSTVGVNNLHAVHKFGEATPEVLSKYCIKWFAGEGTFGSVAIAVQKSADKLVAIKVVENKSDAASEMWYLQSLKGTPNIVRFLEHFETPSHISLVMEYLPTQSFMRMHRNFAPAHVQWYMFNLLLALEGVHSHHIIHGDVKPANFLFNIETRKCALVDFGLSFKVGKPLVESGTPGFICPESILLCNESTPAVDIWSAGIVFLSLLSGIYPIFHGMAAKGLKEYIYLFGTKNMERLAGRLDSMQLHSAYTRNLDFRRPLDLKRLCRLFRSYKRNVALYGYPKNCQNCNQPLSLCICCCLFTGHRLEEQPDGFPAEAYDLLSKMLKLDPEDRITARQALHHKFFKKRLCDIHHFCESPERVIRNGLLRVLDPGASDSSSSE